MDSEYKNKLRKSVIAILVYFDIYQHPLTMVEIYELLIVDDNILGNDFSKCENNYKSEAKKISFIEFKIFFINDSQLQNIVGCENNLYFLKGKNNYVNKRFNSYLITEEKYKKILKYSKIFASIPFVNLITVCNTVAYDFPKEDSDFDLFIIAKKNRLFISRLLAFIFLKVFNLRPKNNISRDKFCLSFWVTTDNLNLNKYFFQKFDIYFIYWLNRLVTIYDKEKYYQMFLNSNLYIKNYLPNSTLFITNEIRKSKKYWLKNVIEFVLDNKVGDFLENFFYKIQKNKLPQKIKEMLNKDTRVVFDRKVIKLHGEQDKRKEIFEKFLKNYNSIVKEYRL